MSGHPVTATGLRVEVAAAPHPGLLRAAIEARLAGRAWADGPEAAVADAVARAVERGSTAATGTAATGTAATGTAASGTGAGNGSERDPWR